MKYKSDPRDGRFIVRRGDTPRRVAAHGRTVHPENEKPRGKGKLPVSVLDRALIDLLIVGHRPIEQRRHFTDPTRLSSFPVSWPAEKDADQRESLSTRGTTLFRRPGL